jgi:hypothetical protein
LPALHPGAVREAMRERLSRGMVDGDHRPHLNGAVDWLVRSQDVTPDGGFARGYSLLWNDYFRSKGWQPPYPETTGYIIPTFFAAAHHLGRPDLAARAERAADWEIDVQLPSGAVQGGVIGQVKSPAVFNTGQVMLGWLCALRESGRHRFAHALHRAGRYLVDVMDVDGVWRRGNSQFARGDSTLYNTRTAWALAEAGVILEEPEFSSAAAKNLRRAAERQRANGWLPDCCLADPLRPLLHTTAYAIRGLLEGGRVLGEERLIACAALASERLVEKVGIDGWMSGKHAEDWSGATKWTCLTGQAQMANIWMRLYSITGEAKWLEPIPRVLHFLKSTQNLTSRDPGLRGGIKGSYPVTGDYGRFEVLNWATKFMADALIRDELIHERGAPVNVAQFDLA